MTDTVTQDRVEDRFISRLERLNPEVTPGAKRQHLAELRKSLSFDLGTHIPAFPYIEPFLGEKTGYWRRAMFYLVAGLYATHSKQSQNSFGKAAAILVKERDSSSLEKRFLTLLATEDEAQLAYHLRQFVSLLKAEGIGLNHATLLNDLLFWTHQDRFVQRRWAQQFYGFNPETKLTDEVEMKGQV